ncbi:MAG: hypothetical protein ACREEI_08240, partial [Stellaceae bacterium]
NPIQWIVVGVIAATAVIAVIFALGRRPSWQKAVIGGGARNAVGQDLQGNVERLIKLAWGAREDTANIDLVLSSEKVSTIVPREEFIQFLLNHTRRIAPSLSVPMMTPRLVIEETPLAAGRFVENDGWVKISVGKNFMLDPKSARAILCHEFCHYVLEANGIREPTTHANERLTDVAIFVLGLGDIFLAGYHREAEVNYRPGHRLGYLNDTEYQYVDDLVFNLRLSGKNQPTKAAGLERRYKAAIPDAGARKRLLDNARTKHPGEPEAELIQRVLEAYERDRR